MKQTKIPTNLAKNASKQHRYILDLLTSEGSIFKNFNIRQEVPVKNINPNFKTYREKIDICILDLKVCCEVHGKQHYEPACFGGIDGEEALRKFREQQERDYLKKTAIEEAGWAYIAISYKETKLTLGELTIRIQEALDSVEEYIEIEKPKQKIKSNSKLQSKGFHKKPEGFKYKWPTKKIK